MEWDRWSGTDGVGQTEWDRWSGTDGVGQMEWDRRSGTDGEWDRWSGTDGVGQMERDRRSGTDGEWDRWSGTDGVGQMLGVVRWREEGTDKLGGGVDKQIVQKLRNNVSVSQWLANGYAPINMSIPRDLGLSFS